MTVTTGSFLVDLLAVFTAIIAIIYTYFKWSYQYWKRRNVPSLEPTVPFGNFKNPYTMSHPIGEECVEWYRQAKARGLKYCGMYNLASPNILILDPELLKRVMTKDFSHFTSRGLYINDSDPISCHVFALGGNRWKTLRVKVSPTFTSGKMKAMFQTVLDNGINLEKYMEENINSKEPVDIKDIVSRFTTDVIGSSAFGLDCNSFENPNTPFRKYGRKFLYSTRFECLKILFCQSFPNLGRALGLKVIPDDVSAFYTKIIEDAVNYRQRNHVVRRDFLQLLMDIKNNKEENENGFQDGPKTLTIDEIAAQAFFFFLAGFETSSITMTFALFELATHPEIQDRVRGEINTVLAKHDNKITYDSLSELKYMKQVIDETLRKYPVLPILTRECVEDYTIPGEDVIIKKGVGVIIPVQGLHYDEEYYKDPQVFDPDRFTEENKQKRHHYTQLGFGEGPRICIGERFGVMQIKIGLTTILKRFKVKLNARTKLPLEMKTVSIIAINESEIWFDMEKI